MKSNCSVTDINVIKILIHRFILYLHPFNLFCYLSLQSNTLSISVWFSYINNFDCLYLQVPVLHYNLNTTFMLSIFFFTCILKLNYTVEKIILFRKNRTKLIYLHSYNVHSL